MLSMQTVHIVRHKVLVQGVSVQHVARELGLSRTTVYKYLEGSTPGRVETTPRRHPVLEAVSPRIDTLSDGCQNPPSTAERRLCDQRPLGAPVPAPETLAERRSVYPPQRSAGRVSRGR